MLVNKAKSERNSSLEYYYMTSIGKTKHKLNRLIAHLRRCSKKGSWYSRGVAFVHGLNYSLRFLCTFLFSRNSAASLGWLKRKTFEFPKTITSPENTVEKMKNADNDDKNYWPRRARRITEIFQFKNCSHFWLTYLISSRNVCVWIASFNITHIQYPEETTNI